MKCYCHECLKVFDEADTAINLEYHPEVAPPNYERFATSPCCRASFGEAAQCKMCGNWYAPDELIAGVYCFGCLEDHMDSYTLEQYVRDDLYYFAEWLYDKLNKNNK